MLQFIATEHKDHLVYLLIDGGDDCGFNEEVSMVVLLQSCRLQNISEPDLQCKSLLRKIGETQSYGLQIDKLSDTYLGTLKYIAIIATSCNKTYDRVSYELTRLADEVRHCGVIHKLRTRLLCPSTAYCLACVSEVRHIMQTAVCGT